MQPQGRLHAFNVLVGGIVALAGVVFTGWQVFFAGNHNAPQAIQVTVAAPVPATVATPPAPQTVATSPVAPAPSAPLASNTLAPNAPSSDLPHAISHDMAQTGGAAPAPVSGTAEVPAIDTTLALMMPVRLSAALNDGSEKKYAFASLFDPKTETPFTIAPPDTEVNVLAEFGASRIITGIEYVPPPVSIGAKADVLDVMVFPDGQMDGSGMQVRSFPLQTTPGAQTLMLPAPERGSSLSLRIAGAPDSTQAIQVGKFRILGSVPPPAAVPAPGALTAPAAAPVSTSAPALADVPAAVPAPGALKTPAPASAPAATP